MRLLISEVSELQKDNVSLRKELASLQNSNEALSHNLQTLQQQQPKKRPATTHTRSTKLRGSPEDIVGGKESKFVSRLEALEDKLACVSDDSNAYNVYFEGCNVHVRDGSGSTQGAGTGEQSGRGNIIIGYNEIADGDEAPEICSNSSAADELDCRATGGSWGRGLQTGIHNLVVGAGHSFTRHSGVISGTHNAITGIAATVLGGHSNVGSGDYSTIAGGVENIASGKTSVVLGGFDNIASGDDSLVGGGSYNGASGSVAVVIGGENNHAHGDMSFISGGSLNRVMGEYACATSSFATTATGKETAIAGGRGVVAALDETMIAGHMFGMKSIGAE